MQKEMNKYKGELSYTIYNTANSPAPVGGRPEVKNECVTQHLSYLVSSALRSIKPATQSAQDTAQLAQGSTITHTFCWNNFSVSFKCIVPGGGKKSNNADAGCILLGYLLCYPTWENLSKDDKVEFAQFWNKLNLLNKISEILRNANIHRILTHLWLRLGQNGS